MFAVLTIKTNHPSQRRDTPLDFADLLIKLAVIKQPRHLDVIHVFDVRIYGVAVIDRNPNSTGAHDAEHTKQYPGVVVRVDSSWFLIAQSARHQRASNAFGGGLHLAIGP